MAVFKKALKICGDGSIIDFKLIPEERRIEIESLTEELEKWRLNDYQPKETLKKFKEFMDEFKNDSYNLLGSIQGETNVLHQVIEILDEWCRLSIKEFKLVHSKEPTNKKYFEELK